ncbi:hypothetical protein SAMD00079811_03870 [Scytonema sp. HK-05]|nr:hypothetical protein SAMD00079811_03870 [Scytonema sp. HK-05]
MPSAGKRKAPRVPALRAYRYLLSPYGHAALYACGTKSARTHLCRESRHSRSVSPLRVYKIDKKLTVQEFLPSTICPLPNCTRAIALAMFEICESTSGSSSSVPSPSSAVPGETPASQLPQRKSCLENRARTAMLGLCRHCH